MRDTQAEEVFVVNQISEDTILGMPFLITQNSHLHFVQPILLVDGRELTCTDRHGRLLMSNVQVIQTALLCRVTARNFCPLSLVESHPEYLPFVTSLSRLQKIG